MANVQQSTIQIVNEVQKRLGVNATTSLTATKLTATLLDLLNDVIEECSDFADWQEMFRETLVTAQSSVSTYVVEASANIKNIYEIAWNNDVSPLEVREIHDLRRLNRLASYGTPRQMAVVGVSGDNPKIRVYPTPTTAATFDVAFYKKPRLLVSTDVSAVQAFPSRVLVKGLYAKAVLREAGGTPTPEYQTAYTEYIRDRKESSNRFTSDTGTDIRITPNG